MSTNVVPIFGAKKKIQNAPVPQSMEGPVLAIIDWAQSNGIDVDNNLEFKIRLADFMALLRTEITKAEAQCA